MRNIVQKPTFSYCYVNVCYNQATDCIKSKGADDRSAKAFKEMQLCKAGRQKEKE